MRVPVHVHVHVHVHVRVRVRAHVYVHVRVLCMRNVPSNGFQLARLDHVCAPIAPPSHPPSPERATSAAATVGNFCNEEEDICPGCWSNRAYPDYEHQRDGKAWVDEGESRKRAKLRSSICWRLRINMVLF